MRWILALVAAQLALGCVVVDAGEIGVVSTFGSVSKDTLSPGLTVLAPWKTVTKYSTQIQEYTMSANVQEGEVKRDDSLRVLSADGLEVTIDATVVYRIDPSRVISIYSELGDDVALKSKVVRPVSRTRVRDSAVSFNAVDLYGGKREQFQKLLLDSVTKDFATRGVILEQLLIRDMKLPERVKNSIEDKIAAEQASEKMKFVLEKAKQEAEQKRIEAQGVADAQKILDSGLSDRVLRYEQIKANNHLSNSPNAKVIFIPTGSNLMVTP